MWAILACTGEHKATERQTKAWDGPFERYYEFTHLLERWPTKGQVPLKYVLVRREYQ